MNKKSGALFTVFLAVLIDLMGFGIVLPLLPFLASTFHPPIFLVDLINGVYSFVRLILSPILRLPSSINAVSILIGSLYTIYSLMQLVFSPFWGGLSDKLGRRPIMLVSTFGSSLAYFLFAFSNSYGLLFFSRFLAGIMGGNISTAQAYVADVTPPEQRAKGMGIIGAAFGIGFVLGPVITVLLTSLSFLNFFHIQEAHKYMMPGFFASALSFISFLLVWTKLPEPEKHNVETASDVGRIVKNSVFSKEFWKMILDERRYAKHLFPLLMLCMFLLSFGQSSLYMAFPLFCKDLLNLSAQDVGMLFVYIGLVTAFIQGYLIRKLTKVASEEFLFLIGSALMVLGFILIPFSHSKAVLGWMLCLLSVGLSLNGPTITSLISKESDPAQVGKTMGTAQGISGLGRVIGPIWGSILYGISYKFPFLITSGILFITIYAGFELHKAHHSFKTT